MTTVAVQLRLPNATLTQLQQMARRRATTEAAVITQALDLLARSDDAPVRNDYWFSVAAMRQDWDAMPNDWMADESLQASSTLAARRDPAIDLVSLRTLLAGS